jgi:hypothetical protein
VNVIYFTVNRDDSATNDGLQNESTGSKDELASHVHLTQVHNLITRVSGQLDRVQGEQRYFRARCVPAPHLQLLIQELCTFGGCPT